MNEKPQRPPLLLHACCAPCSTIPLERLRDHFQVTVFFYGPNIHPREEYQLRLADVERLCRHHGLELIQGAYRPSDWGRAVAPFRALPEGSQRCEACYRLRMTETARCARTGFFSCFTVTLTTARQKDSRLLARIGAEVAKAEGIEYLNQDFKKHAGFDLSLVRSRELGLRRQDYCGCTISRTLALKRGSSVLLKRSGAG